jgi:glycosyltransferase involved in cell wall biosynthesis
VIRRALWIVRVLAAAGIGAIVRFARRVARRPPRIWHGFTPVHSTRWIVEAEREAGLPSLSVVTHTRASRYPLVRREDFDVVFEQEAGRWDDVHWLALTHLLRHGDVWNAWFDCLFFQQNDRRKNALAMQLIRAVGIRIVAQVHGSDVVCLGKIESRYDWPARMQLDYPLWDLGAQRAVVENRVALFSRYAHFIIAGDSIFAGFLDRWDVLFHTVPADTRRLAPVFTTGNTVPLIVHAPNHRNVKGTEFLLRAVERLQARGIACELRLIEGIPRHEALALYDAADIIADQFILGGFGIFALEGMALGKPVLTYLDEQHLRNPLLVHPLVNTTPENVEEVLAVLLQLPELRERIGRAARASVERYQSFEVMAEVWMRVYRHVWWGEPLALETTRHFDPARGTRAVTEDPREAAFWPVEVGDLMGEIEKALSR